MYESTKLEYTKTCKEEQEEQSMVATAEYYLRRFGVETKTDYGYYRNTYDILKDLGEYLIEAGICKARPSLAVEAVSRITTIEEDMFTPEQVRKMTREEVRDNYKKIIESMKYWN
jgi:5-enolpyruvylshikimate-3-phosphate synthase